MRPATLERVRRAIGELGYRPDAGASALRRADGRSSAIGVVVDDVSNPFSGAVMRAVEAFALRGARDVVAVSEKLSETWAVSPAASRSIASSRWRRTWRMPGRRP